MHLPTQIAKHMNDVFFGGNWTSVNMREHLIGLTWQQATARIYDHNSIAALTFHINYFVVAQITCSLEGHSMPMINSVLTSHPSNLKMIGKIYFKGFGVTRKNVCN